MTLVIKATLDRFEDGKAVIKTEDGQEIIWPTNKLPEEITAGNSLSITISSNIDKTSAKEGLAKNMLNEILNVEDEPSNKH